jgi:hypothetical protein
LFLFFVFTVFCFNSVFFLTYAIGFCGANQIEVQEEGKDKAGGGGQRRKDPELRRKELLGSGDTSLAAKLLSEAAGKLEDWLQSETACDTIVELATGASDGELAMKRSDYDVCARFLAIRGKEALRGQSTESPTPCALFGLGNLNYHLPIPGRKQ